MPVARSLALGPFLFLLFSTSASPAAAGKVQFGVAELPGTTDPNGDSYVLLIDESETELLAHARSLVDWVQSGGDPAGSPGATIVVTEIAPGSGGFNRNFRIEGEPFWSWHPVGTPSFADITIEILDGWPTFVEQDVEGWIANTNGFVGFWGYTVVAELGLVVPEPASRGVLIAAAVLVAAHRSRLWERPLRRSARL